MFTDSQGEAYASFAVAHGEGETHRETHKIKSRGFNRWLRLGYYRERGGSPSSEAMSSAVKTVEARAFFDGFKQDVYLRAAALDGRVYIDLCNERWQAIEIDADGWRGVDDVPVHFRREAGMLPLPTPKAIDPKKGVARLKEVLRLRDEGDLVMVCRLGARRARRPVTLLHGPRFHWRVGQHQIEQRLCGEVTGRPQRLAAAVEAERCARGLRRRVAFLGRGL